MHVSLEGRLVVAVAVTAVVVAGRVLAVAAVAELATPRAAVKAKGVVVGKGEGQGVAARRGGGGAQQQQEEKQEEQEEQEEEEHHHLLRMGTD